PGSNKSNVATTKNSTGARVYVTWRKASKPRVINFWQRDGRPRVDEELSRLPVGQKRSERNIRILGGARRPGCRRPVDRRDYRSVMDTGRASERRTLPC